MTEPMKDAMNMGEPNEGVENPPPDNQGGDNNEGVEELPQPDAEPHDPPAPLKNRDASLKR